MENLKKLYLWLTLLPSAVVLLLTVYILFFLKFLPAKLPLFYSLPWGEKQLANHLQFLILPLVLTLIIILNFIISISLHSAQVFFKKILNIATLLSTTILIITFIRIIYNFL